MPTSPDPRRRREFPTEGFTLHFDAAGLEIRVNDYRPLPLKLNWDLIEQLRREAQSGRAAGEGHATGSGPMAS